MNTMLTVARYHLVRPVQFVGLPWATLAFAFAVNVARGGDTFRNGLTIIFGMFFMMGVLRIGRWLPFGLALGATRRSFYAGTALLGVSMSLVSGLVIAGLQAIERGHRRLGTVHHLLPGAASPERALVRHLADLVRGAVRAVRVRHVVRDRVPLVGHAGSDRVHCRPGAGRLAVTFAYSGAGGYLASLSALDLTGVIAALTVVVLAGGHTTIRRLPVCRS